jgi:hypothetical protein
MRETSPLLLIIVRPFGKDLTEGLILRRGKLEPLGWRVREAFSPFWSLSQRWWSLILCVEGLVAVRLPVSEWWPIVLRAGLRAGVSHLPTTVAGGNWPLSVPHNEIKLRSPRLFPRESIARLEVVESRFFWNNIHIVDREGKRLVLTMADRRQARSYTLKLAGYVPGPTSGSDTPPPA